MRLVKEADKFSPELIKSRQPKTRAQKKFATKKTETVANKPVEIVDRTGLRIKQRISAFSLDPEEPVNEKKMTGFVEFMYRGMERKHLRNNYIKFNSKNEQLPQSMHFGILTTTRKTWFYNLFEKTVWLNCEVSRIFYYFWSF